MGQKAQNQIEAGVIEIVDRHEVTGEVTVRYTETQQRSIKTVWHRATHDAGNQQPALKHVKENVGSTLNKALEAL